jgi:ribosomal protein S3AE
MIEKLKFTKIDLPIIGQKADVLAKELKELENKKVVIDLTRIMRGKSIEAIFKLHVQGDKVVADLERLHIFPFYIRRIMRKSVDYVEDSFDVKVKDLTLRVKPFLITRKKVHRSVRTALKNMAKEEIINTFKEHSSEAIFKELLSGKFQKTLSLKLKKIYPLTFCDIRDIFIKPEQKMEVAK